MSFLKLPKGKESGKKSTAPDVTAQEAFDFLYDQCPVDGATLDHRYLELGHFEPLATAVQLNLEDLSLYLLAYLADESPKTIFKISEKRFVTWLTTLAAALPRSAAPPTRENAYAPLFAAAKAAVITLNASLRTNEDLRVKFYHFLYHWCLKGNEASDRMEIAKELWSCFFSASPLSFSKEEAKLKFTAYVCFPRINQWLDFITALSEKTTGAKQVGATVEQMRVSFDTWSQLIPFAKLNNYNDYNDEDSWPVAMDDFVDYALKLESTNKA